MNDVSYVAWIEIWHCRTDVDRVLYHHVASPRDNLYFLSKQKILYRITMYAAFFSYGSIAFEIILVYS